MNYGEILHEYGLTERTDLGSDPNEILAVQMEGQLKFTHLGLVDSKT